MFDPNDEARKVANRAKLRSFIDADLEHGGRLIKRLREAVRDNIKNVNKELIYDYFFSTDEEIQKTFDKIENWRRALALLDKECENLKDDESAGCPCGKNHPKIGVVEIGSIDDLFRMLFGE